MNDITKVCDNCRGSGEQFGGFACEECGGTGKISQRNILDDEKFVKLLSDYRNSTTDFQEKKDALIGYLNELLYDAEFN